MFYWDYLDDPSIRATWRDFITRWVKSHPQGWELAELHWLKYVEEFLSLRDFERLSSVRLIRKCEGAAQNFLMYMLVGGGQCKYCVIVKSQTRGQEQ